MGEFDYSKMSVLSKLDQELVVYREGTEVSVRGVGERYVFDGRLHVVLAARGKAS